MAINLQKHCDNKAISGYGSALLYRDAQAGDSLYHLLLPLETVPAVNGSVDTFEFDLLTCPTKGQVEGKESLDQKDVEFLWHRDNVKRLEKLQGRVIDFLAVYGDLTGRKFSGTIKVRPNDATGDIHRGTFTITPISASITTIDDVSSFIQDTVSFASTIPAKLEISSTAEVSVECLLDPTSGTIAVSSSSTAITATTGNGAFTVKKGTSAKVGDTAIITIKATASGMASWETSMLVEVVA